MQLAARSWTTRIQKVQLGKQVLDRSWGQEVECSISFSVFLLVFSLSLGGFSLIDSSVFLLSFLLG